MVPGRRAGVRASGAPGAKLLAGAERNHGGKRGLERGSGLTTAAPGTRSKPQQWCYIPEHHSSYRKVQRCSQLSLEGRRLGLRNLRTLHFGI